MIPTFKPSILRKDMDAVLTCMVEELFGTDEITKDFQKKLAKQMELNTVFGIREYQRSFEILLDMFELDPGASVALSPLSPWWYHVVLKKRGLTPLYIDVDPDRCIIEKKGLESVEGNADLLFIYHNLGYENDPAVTGEMEIPVVEDITEILASRILSEKKSFAGSGLFSLKEQGFMAGMSGSYVFLRDRKDVSQMKKFTDLLDESQLVSDIQTALSSSQLSRLSKYNEKRIEIHKIYLSSLLKTKNRTFAVDEESGHIPYSFPVILHSGSREVFQYARKKKIQCAGAFDETVIARFPDEVNECPGARTLSLRCVLFPLYPSLSSTDVNTVSRVLSTLP